MKLVLAEKPSVAQSIAKVLGAAKREDGYLEGNGYVVSWCVGHLVELAQPEVYDAKYSKWAYHLKILQCLPDGFFLLRRALELLGVLSLRLVVVLPLLDAALALDLCNIEVAHVQTGVLLDVLPDLFIGSLVLHSSHVQLIHLQVYRDLLVDI